LSQASAGLERVVGFVLAGGESSRMGQDKALLPFAGRPLVVHALAMLREAGLEARIAGARSALEGLAPVVPDAGPGRGPLGGVCAALGACTGRWAVFLPVDLPLVPASLIAFLVYRAQVSGDAVTVASAGGFAQTFPAVVDPAALPALESELKSGHGGCFAAFQAAAAGLGQSVAAVPVELLAQSGQAAHPDGLPAGVWFVNVNSPVDLRRAESLLGLFA
jgi:molybdopterin-guanine dinucleotide biosynthesis protein A